MRKLFANLLVVIVALGFAACGPSKTVQIPQEWQVPTPPRSTSPAETKPTAKAPDSRPIIKPSPTIKESDISQLPQQAPPPPAETKKPAGPQHLASMHLVDQAKASLSQGDPDQAVALSEQAIQVDVYNGDAFFTLARAWKMKGSPEKALEFSSKAEILFQDEPSKLKEVYLFEAATYKELGDATKAESYRQKAARL